MPPEQEVAIQVHIINLGDELDVGIGILYLRNCPFPKVEWHHEHHVASECIDSFGSPIAQDMEHFEPCGGDGGEVACAVAVVDPIVEFHSLIPVVARGECIEAVVA